MISIKYFIHILEMCMRGPHRMRGIVICYYWWMGAKYSSACDLYFPTAGCFFFLFLFFFAVNSCFVRMCEPCDCFILIPNTVSPFPLELYFFLLHFFFSRISPIEQLLLVFSTNHCHHLRCTFSQLDSTACHLGSIWVPARPPTILQIDQQHFE